MARAHLLRPVQDQFGNLVTGVTVNVYEPGTSDPITEQIFLTDTTTQIADQPLGFETGVISFYLAEPKRVRLGVRKGGTAEIFYDDVDVLAVSGPAAATGLEVYAPDLVPNATGVTLLGFGNGFTVTDYDGEAFVEYTPPGGGGGGDSHALGDSFDAKNADRYDRRRYAAVYRSGSATVANNGFIPMPLTDHFNDEGGSVLPQGIVEYADGGGTQIGLQFPGRGLYKVEIQVGIDTTGGAFDVGVQERHSYNSYLAVGRLDPAFSNRQSRIFEWSGVIASSGTDDINTPNQISVKVFNSAGTSKVLTCWIVAFPL